MATAPRRVRSFSHLPRPRRSREEFIRYLGDRAAAAENAIDSNPTNGGVVSGAGEEEGVDGTKERGSDGQVSDPLVSDAIVVESGEEVVVQGGAVGGDDASSEVARPRRLLRRWPSSADIGMVTDGR